MDAFFNTIDRSPGNSARIEDAGGVGRPLIIGGGCSLDPGTLEVPGAVSIPACPAPGTYPPWSGSCRDDASVLRPDFGEGGCGGVSLAKASEPSESSDEDRPAQDLAGLCNM